MSVKMNVFFAPVYECTVGGGTVRGGREQGREGRWREGGRQGRWFCGREMERGNSRDRMRWRDRKSVV